RFAGDAVQSLAANEGRLCPLAAVRPDRRRGRARRAAAGRVLMSQGNYAERSTVKHPPWHGLVAWDMVCNGLATGLFLVAALGELVDPAQFAALAKVAYPVALFFLVVDLILLVVDLGDPWRFHHMLRIVKLQSPMSLGVWSLTAFSLPLTVAAALG